MAVGQNLKRIAKEQGVTIKQIAEKSGVSVQTLYNITARNSIHVRTETLIKIARALGVGVYDLWGLDDFTHSEFFRIYRKFEEVGVRIMAEEENGYMWLEYPDGGTLEVSDIELRQLDDRAKRNLKTLLNDYREDRGDGFIPNEEEVTK